MKEYKGVRVREKNTLTGRGGNFMRRRGESAGVGAGIGRSNRAAVEEIRAADAGWLKVFAARDLEKSVAFCDEEASMMVPHGPAAKGKKAIAKKIAAGFGLREYKLVWHAEKAGVARSGELGYTCGKYRFSFRDASGKIISDRGKYLVVWRKRAGGEWKVLFDMNNSDLPMG